MYRYYLIIVFASLALAWVKFSFGAPLGYVHGYDTVSSLPVSLDDYMKKCDQYDKPCVAFAHQELLADIRWLDFVQVASLSKDTKIDNVTSRIRQTTTLSPYWVDPYVWGSLLATMPEMIDSYTGDLEVYIQHMVAYTQEYLCRDDAKYVDEWSDKDFIQYYYDYQYSTQLYVCRDYRPLHLLGFVSYHYLDNIDQAVSLYKLAALSPGAPDTMISMPALIQARHGDRLMSMVMRYMRAISLEGQLNALLSDDLLLQLVSERDYTLRKAVDSYILASITDIAKEYDCDISIECVQNHFSTYLTSQIASCEHIHDLLDEARCFVLEYGLQQGFIMYDGQFMYPFGDDMQYGWRPDVQDWWIIPV